MGKVHLFHSEEAGQIFHTQLQTRNFYENQFKSQFFSPKKSNIEPTPIHLINISIHFLWNLFLLDFSLISLNSNVVYNWTYFNFINLLYMKPTYLNKLLVHVIESPRMCRAKLWKEY